MRDDALGDFTFEFHAALQVHVEIEQLPLGLPRKWKPQRETFVIKPADCPRHVSRCRALDKINAWTFGQIVVQFINGPQRQARARCQIDMRNRRMIPQDFFAGLLGRGNDAPRPPLTFVTGREGYFRHVRHGTYEFVVARLIHLSIDMDNDRATAFHPIADHLLCTMQRGVNQHNYPNLRHAQFPLDIRPRISS